MTIPWRLWVMMLTILAALTSVFGMQAGMAGIWWPIAGLWLAAGLACFGLSVWVGINLVLLGVVMDYLGEGPVGAWSLALIAAYGVALVAWDRQPPIPVIGAEVISVVGGFIAASLALGVAGSIAGRSGFARGPLMADFVMTSLFYPLVRFVIVPGNIRVARR